MRSRSLAAGLGAGALTLALVPLAGSALSATAAPDHPAGTASGPARTVKVPARYLDQNLSWVKCGDPEDPGPLGRVECAMVTAPRDWNNPNAGTDIKVAVSRLEPKTGTPSRVVFGNPGGPGAPGLGMALLLADKPAIADHSTLIGFDPRGTGSSTNVSCNGAPSYTMDARDRDAENLDLTATASKLISRYCVQQSRGLLPYITTEQTVKDMDLIRVLLGFQRIDYVGYSGGTWLGAYYQTYFPKHVGRFVLDSNTDFTAPWRKTFEAQPQSFERRFRQDFGSWAAKYDDVLHLGDTTQKVHAFYEKLRADLKRTPITIDLGFVQIAIDQNAVDGDVVSSMYSKTEFQALAEDLAFFRGLSDEQATGGARSAQAKFDALPAARQKALVRRIEQNGAADELGVPVAEDAADASFYAITCNDTIWPRGQAYADLVSSVNGPHYPLTGWGLNENPCYYWNRPSLSMPVPDGKGIPTTLMVQSTHDPATNASLGFNAHRHYAGSRLITVENEGDHGIYVGVNTCVDKLVDKFLTTGAAPVHDATCQGEGIPAPTSSRDHSPDQGLKVNPLTKIAGYTNKLSGFKT